MKVLKIVFVNRRKLNARLHQLKGNVLQGRAELQTRLGELRHSLEHSLPIWKQYRITEAMEEALIFKLKNNGEHPRLLI